MKLSSTTDADFTKAGTGDETAKLSASKRTQVVKVRLQKLKGN